MKMVIIAVAIRCFSGGPCKITPIRSDLPETVTRDGVGKYTIGLKKPLKDVKCYAEMLNTPFDLLIHAKAESKSISVSVCQNWHYEEITVFKHKVYKCFTHVDSDFYVECLGWTD